MSTKKETKKAVCKTFWITEQMEKMIKELGINVTDTCRNALNNEIQKLSKAK